MWLVYAVNLRHADIICTMHYALVMHFACSNEYLAQNTEPYHLQPITLT